MVTTLNNIVPKDFIETSEGLVFAVVMAGLEHDKVRCFLRYIKEGRCWKKQSTEQANTLLAQYYPQYMYYSPVLEAHLHGVPLACIVTHYQPKQRLQQLMHMAQRDAVENDAYAIALLWQQHGIDVTQMGLTGSLLIGAQKYTSDIDLVCYQRDTFQQCRQLINVLIQQDQLQSLSHDDWHEAYARRNCALSFNEYVWHERRKYNKAMINGRKFDLYFLNNDLVSRAESYKKVGTTTLQCVIIDDSRAYDYPAEFMIDNDQIGSIVSFTATYIGQAQRGERIEAHGTVEQSCYGQRIVIGSTREAPGEYLKVLHG